VDEWPEEGLLVAATNHAELLDPAVWRRFDRVVQFPLPSRGETRSLIVRLLREEARHIHDGVLDTLTALLEGKSFADISRFVLLARRTSVLQGVSTDAALLEQAGRIAREQSLETRLEIARLLADLGQSQRSVSELTGLSRDTIRKYSEAHGVVRTKG
jgi:SpoVK/Ycf46/Vps4 family AAA+-type ATPase